MNCYRNRFFLTLYLAECCRFSPTDRYRSPIPHLLMPRQNILVVDDSPTERHFLSELLSSQGYQVSTAENGEAAITLIKNHPPHLIIMDVVMPGQNGFQTTREISRDPSTQHLPIIICSSKNQETDRIWGMRQGAREFMVKPVDPMLLLKKIAILLAHAG